MNGTYAMLMQNLENQHDSPQLSLVGFKWTKWLENTCIHQQERSLSFSLEDLYFFIFYYQAKKKN